MNCIWCHPNFSRSMPQEVLVEDCRLELLAPGAAAHNCPCHPSTRVNTFNSITNRMEIAPRCFCVDLQGSRVPCLLMEYHSHKRHLLSHSNVIPELDNKFLSSSVCGMANFIIKYFQFSSYKTNVNIIPIAQTETKIKRNDMRMDLL